MTCGRAKDHRGAMTRDRRDEVQIRYGLPTGPHPHYEIDHLIPLCLGGWTFLEPMAAAAPHYRVHLECGSQGQAGAPTVRTGLLWSGRYRHRAAGRRSLPTGSRHTADT